MPRIVYFLTAIFIAAIAPLPLHADDDDTGTVAALMVTADFNHDGIPDIAEVIRPSHDKSAQPGYLTLSLGHADGNFKPTGLKLNVGANPTAIVTADFNRDGIPDILVGDEDGTLRIFLGDGKGDFSNGDIVAHLDSVVSLAVADFNHDGIADIAVTDWHASKLIILLGDGTGDFRNYWSAPLRLAGTSPRLTSADFNADGIPDLAVVYGDDGDDGYTYDIMVGDGHGFFVLAPSLSLAWDPITHCAP
jgi:hypothetical protein